MVYWEAAYLWSNLDTTEPSTATTSAITFVSQPLLHHEKEKQRKDSPGLCPGMHKYYSVPELQSRCLMQTNIRWPQGFMRKLGKGIFPSLEISLSSILAKHPTQPDYVITHQAMYDFLIFPQNQISLQRFYLYKNLFLFQVTVQTSKCKL